MNKDIINVLKEYKDKLICDNIKYRIIDVYQDEKTINNIKKIDDKKLYFGGYDLEELRECLHNYYNLGVYYRDKFIGYIGWCNCKNNRELQIIPTIIIKKEYRCLGFGDILLKKFINSTFLDYHVFNSIYTSVNDRDYVSLRMVQNNNFREFNGYEKNNNGELEKKKYFLYTVDEFNKNKKKLKKYGSIF